MANTKSAEKRNRQAEKRRARNRAVTSRLRSTIKKTRATLAETKGDDAAATIVGHRFVLGHLCRHKTNDVEGADQVHVHHPFEVVERQRPVLQLSPQALAKIRHCIEVRHLMLVYPLQHLTGMKGLFTP